MNRPTYDPTKQPLAYNQGFVEAQLEAAAKEGRPGAKEALAAHLLVCQAYDRIRRERDTADEELSLLRPELEKLRAEKARTSDERLPQVTFEWIDLDICYCYVHPIEGGDRKSVGAAYIINGEPGIETSPISNEISHSELRAVLQALENNKARLPLSKSSAL